MKRSLFMLLIVAVCAGFSSAAAAADVSSTVLIEEPAVWDGRVVTFTGEAVGEAMVRGDEVWLHLNDDAYAGGSIASGALPQGYNSGLAVVVDAEDARVVTVFGDYRHQGDVVEVSGVFNAACPEHGGDMDVHATGIRVVREGAVLDHAPGTSSFVLLGIAFAAAVTAVGAYLIRRPRD
ncbi:MAG: hypothetical protein JW733_04280 [Coriobacteriia bacterium]|nr:hypothetical protein [Coriobacteriia bacterium]MBN2839823.1 hypothetical protein [Coriobacteriia bacterium]